MADRKTAAEWSQVVGALSAQKRQLDLQIENISQQQIRPISDQIFAFDKIISNPSSTQAQIDAAARERLILVNQRSQLRNQITQGLEQSRQLQNEIELAQIQVNTADDAPQGTRANPVTSSNPSPANPEPGNNTTVDPLAATITPVTAPEPINGLDLPPNPEPINGLDLPSDPEPINGLDLPPTPEPINGLDLPSDPEPINGLDLPPDVDESDGGLQLPPGADPDEGNQPGLSEPPVVDEEFGDLEGAISRNQEDDAARAETANLASRYPPTAAGVSAAQSSGNLGGYTPFPETRDYRVRISLAPSADYLYMAAKPGDLLYPLIKTKGVVYPYTPVINLTYTANYQNTDLTHTNYKIYNYSGSAVESINITGDFTAQDVNEANYVLAVIHFFRSVTKMFYGQDQNAGVPPPLVYLTGHGEYGFDNHAMVITNFTLNYPNDCDYINAGPGYNINTALNPYAPPDEGNNASKRRLRSSLLQPGGVRQPPMFSLGTNNKSDITRVPTKLNIQLNALPVVSRYNISNNFSLARYATGDLLRGSKNVPGGGMW